MSCFRAFDSNLPVLDVQIMGGGVGWRGAGTDRKKGIEGETAAANLNFQVRVGVGTRSSSLFGRGMFQAFRADPGTGYRLALN